MREKRTVVIGGGFVLAMLLLFKALPAFNEWRDEVRAEAESIAAERALAEQAVSLRADYDDSLKAVTERYLSLRTAVMEDESGADLAAILADAADGAGMRLGAVQITADTTVKNGLIFVSVRADLTGDVRGVTMLLQTLEAGTPLIRVDKLAITNTEPASPRERPENLRTEVTLSGIVRAEES